jgi:hypothetical protein
VWCSERFGPLPADLKEVVQRIKEGDELLVFAYGSLKKDTGEPNLNAKGVFILGAPQAPA